MVSMGTRIDAVSGATFVPVLCAAAAVKLPVLPPPRCARRHAKRHSVLRVGQPDTGIVLRIVPAASSRHRLPHLYGSAPQASLQPDRILRY